MNKTLLILCAMSDPCDEEIALIEAVGKLMDMTTCKTTLLKEADLKNCLCNKDKALWDYIYLATHADIHGFGDSYSNGLNLRWSKFAQVICEADCLASGAMLFLGCCRGGLKRVADRLFDNCSQIDYVCGPRWALKPDDLAAAFHIFLYNLEIRAEQPSVAVGRASNAVGYDFFCYDRAEREDIHSDDDTDPEGVPETNSGGQDHADGTQLADDGSDSHRDACSIA